MAIDPSFRHNQNLLETHIASVTAGEMRRPTRAELRAMLDTWDKQAAELWQWDAPWGAGEALKRDGVRAYQRWARWYQDPGRRNAAGPVTPGEWSESLRELGRVARQLDMMAVMPSSGVLLWGAVKETADEFTDAGSSLLVVALVAVVAAWALKRR